MKSQLLNLLKDNMRQLYILKIQCFNSIGNYKLQISQLKMVEAILQIISTCLIPFSVRILQ
jgi:hypothetical protein